MAKYNKTWRVLPHLPIEELSDNLWRVQGTLEKMALKRVMVIARRPSGGLVIHNAVPLERQAMDRLLQWGSPEVLLVPSGFHRLDAHAFKQRFPQLRVLCPRGAAKRVSQVVAVDGTYDDFPADEVIELLPLGGIADAEGVMRVRSQDGASLVFNDLIFNQPHGRGLMGLVFRHLTRSTGGPCISRVLRWFVIKDRAALAASLEQLAQTPELRRILVAHHRTISEDPAGTLRRLARSL